MDMVKAPPHYTGGEIEPKDIITDLMLPHWVANAVKYLWRHKAKNGRQDLEKAAQCLRLHHSALDIEAYHALCKMAFLLGLEEDREKYARVLGKKCGIPSLIYAWDDQDSVSDIIGLIDEMANNYKETKNGNT